MMREFDGTAFLIGLAILLILLAFFHKRGGWFLLFLSVFWFYLPGLVSVTLFPMPLIVDVERVGIWTQIALGVWLGVVAFWIFARMIMAFTQRINVKKHGVLAYMLSVME